MTVTPQHINHPSLSVDAVEIGTRAAKGYTRCVIEEDVKFREESLSEYLFSKSKHEVFDALVVAGVVDFCDMQLRRPTNGWARSYQIRIPVHDPDKWNSPNVSNPLHKALHFLSGDKWSIHFKPRKAARQESRQATLTLPFDTLGVIPYSDGMDSHAVASLLQLQHKDRIVRVRLGAKQKDYEKRNGKSLPFASVPYQVPRSNNAESSGRSRGFKFATIGGLAAHLAHAEFVFAPESGQGALGPSLVTVGQIYPDYRSHPTFFSLMEEYLHAILGNSVRFQLPQLWKTKAETLRDYISLCTPDEETWKLTWSCWQKSRQVSVDKRKRQCGICAACMLRRLSIHAAGLADDPQMYMWENLKASKLEDGRASSCSNTSITKRMREYAIAGTLHLDHLASIRHSKAHEMSINLEASRLAKTFGMEQTDVYKRMIRLLEQHEREWNAFLDDLGENSFIRDWAKGGR